MSTKMPSSVAEVVATPFGQASIWSALACVKDFAIFSTNTEGLIMMWNSGSECLFGYTAAEVLGKHTRITFTPEDRAAGAPEKEMETARENGVAADERWHQRKDGSRFFASGKVTPFYDETGFLIGFTKVCQDLTEEVKRREQLEQSEERYRVLVELSPQGVWLGRADGYITYCNQHWINLTGLSLQQTEGSGWLQAITPEHRQRVLDTWQQAVRTVQESEVEMPVRTRDGIIRWYLARAKPLLDENGHVRRWIGIAIDIHDRKLAEFAEASFRVLFEAMPSLYVVVTPRNYTIAAVSEAYLRATMIERANIIHQCIFDVFPDNPDHSEFRGAANLKASFERVKALRRSDIMPVQPYPIRRPQGQSGVFENRWWSTINSPVFGENGEIVYIIHRVEDVTDYIGDGNEEALEFEQMLEIHSEHIQAEIVLHAREFQRLNEQLIQSEQQYRAMFEFASVGMVQADSATGRFLRVNEKFCDITGYSTQELLEMGIRDLTHPDERALDWETYQRAARQETAHYLTEKRYVRKDGNVVWVRVSAAFVRDLYQRAAHSFAVVEEITLRKEAERALQEADRRKTEFLAMLAHELRNPLAALRTAAQACREERSTEIYEWGVSVIERQATQLTRLVDDLLDVSRITLGMIRLHKERLDAAILLDHAVESARPLIREHYHELFLSYDRSGTGLPVEADAARLEQIVSNLLTNAAKYTDDHGRIELSARLEKGEILILVRDNGIGIAPEKLSELFELFAQGERGIARSEGGLGIGLAIVKRLAEMHGGSVTASSQGPGHGSQFLLRLPAAEPATPLPLPPPVESNQQAASTRILVVDDNKDTAEGMARLLRRRGYTVELAFDGLAALTAANSSLPDFVLLDIGLPGLDGYQVAATLRDNPACSKMCLIAISGYGQDEDRERSRTAGFDYHLTKPLNFTELEHLLTAPREPA